MTAQLETQEAGTGKWFAVVQYVPGNEKQRLDAESMADLFRFSGLLVRLTGFQQPKGVKTI